LDVLIFSAEPGEWLEQFLVSVWGDPNPGIANNYPDPSDIRQQIASLVKAKNLVIPHGAGLANMRLRQSDAKLSS